MEELDQILEVRRRALMRCVFAVGVAINGLGKAGIARAKPERVGERIADGVDQTARLQQANWK